MSCLQKCTAGCTGIFWTMLNLHQIVIWIISFMSFFNILRQSETCYPYHFLWANQQKADINDQRIVTHSLNRSIHWEWIPRSKASDVHIAIIEFFTIDVSVRLSDRSLHRKEQKNIRQKFPPVGIETRTSGSWGQCSTNWARQEICWAGDFWSELCLFHTPLHMLNFVHF